MRHTEFRRRVEDEFGAERASWLLHSHVVSGLGATPDELSEQGVDLALIWEGLCRDFDIPEERWFGEDL